MRLAALDNVVRAIARENGRGVDEIRELPEYAEYASRRHADSLDLVEFCLKVEKRLGDGESTDI